MMPSEPDPNLEALIDAELKKLQPIPAPARLVPQVLSILEARAQAPWWQRAWWDWPLSARAAFIVLSLALVVAFSGGGFVFGNEFTVYSHRATDSLTLGGRFEESFAPLTNAAGLLWEKGRSFALCALAMAGVMYLACLGLGTACVRSALKQN